MYNNFSFEATIPIIFQLPHSVEMIRNSITISVVSVNFN